MREWLLSQTTTGATNLQAIIMVVLLAVSLFATAKMIKGDWRVFTSPWREDYEKWRSKINK